MWQITFPIQIGLTPGHLYSVINLLAVNVVKLLRLTYMVKIYLPSITSTSHRSKDALWKEVTKSLHPWASILEWPAALSVFRANSQIRLEVNWLNMIGCSSSMENSGTVIAARDNYWLGECFKVIRHVL